MSPLSWRYMEYELYFRLTRKSLQLLNLGRNFLPSCDNPARIIGEHKIKQPTNSDITSLKIDIKIGKLS